MRALASGLKCLSTYSCPSDSPRLAFSALTARFHRGWFSFTPRSASVEVELGIHERLAEERREAVDE